MSISEQKTLAKLIKNGWKELALSDQTDADEVVQIVRNLLESLEKLESEE